MTPRRTASYQVHSQPDLKSPQQSNAGWAAINDQPGWHPIASDLPGNLTATKPKEKPAKNRELETIKESKPKPASSRKRTAPSQKKVPKKLKKEPLALQSASDINALSSLVPALENAREIAVDDSSVTNRYKDPYQLSDVNLAKIDSESTHALVPHTDDYGTQHSKKHDADEYEDYDLSLSDLAKLEFPIASTGGDCIDDYDNIDIDDDMLAAIDLVNSSPQQIAFDEYEQFDINSEQLDALDMLNSETTNNVSSAKQVSSKTAPDTRKSVQHAVWLNAASLTTELGPELPAMPSSSDVHSGKSCESSTGFDHCGQPILRSSSVFAPEDGVLHSIETATTSSIQPKPITRPPFPNPIRDRSVILGLSSDSILRTCFRVGEAINVGSAALRKGTNVIIELYARVLHSDRPSSISDTFSDPISSGAVGSSSPTPRSRFSRGITQRFVFRDLFHGHPPHLRGSYDLWFGSEMWDLESQKFLHLAEDSEPKLCRCLGRVKRETDEESKSDYMNFSMLSIREVTWEEIEAIRELVFASS